MRIKTVAAVAILLFLLYYFSKPWDYKEIEKMTIVTGLGLDVGGTKAHAVTFEIMENGTERSVFTTQGDDFFECIEEAQKIVRAPLIYNHVKVALMTDDFAANSLDEFLDFVTDKNDIRLNIMLIMTRDSTANEIFSSTDTNLSFVLADYMKSTENDSFVKGISMRDFYSPYKKGERCEMPTIKLSDDTIEYEGVVYWE